MNHQYPVEVLQAALDKAVSEGLFHRPDGESAVNAALSSLDRLLSESMAVNEKLVELKNKERWLPVKVEGAADIPFPEDDVLFIDASDLPGREVFHRICRAEFRYEVFCFIGSAPEWAGELVMTGYRTYELPAGTVLQIGQRALKPHPSSVGVRWVDVRVGETAIQFN